MLNNTYQFLYTHARAHTHTIKKHNEDGFCLHGIVRKGKTAAPAMTSPKTCWRQTIHVVQCKTRHRERKTYEHRGEILQIQPQQTKPTPQRQPHHHQQPNFVHSNHTKLKQHKPKKTPVKQATLSSTHSTSPNVSNQSHQYV